VSLCSRRYVAFENTNRSCYSYDEQVMMAVSLTSLESSDFAEYIRPDAKRSSDVKRYT